MKLFRNVKKLDFIHNIKKRNVCSKPKHLICFRNWTSDMVLNILESAMNLKCNVGDSHRKRLKVLENSKIMILQEVNEPFLNMAVSKAATMLGAYDVNVTDQLLWDNDYMGRIFSYMADVIFVATMTHMCLKRFADQSSVPVLCMRSRTHATIQSMATIMAIMEEFKTLKNVNLAYFGSPHPVLNSYLLLCPMLGANIRFKCCCQKCPVSPLLFKVSEDMCSHAHTELKQCMSKEDVLKEATVIIAGPSNEDKVDEFKLSAEDIECHTKNKWIFFHTGPRGKEVNNKLFLHNNSKTFVAFENFQYIAAALMADVVTNHKF